MVYLQQRRTGGDPQDARVRQQAHIKGRHLQAHRPHHVQNVLRIHHSGSGRSPCLHQTEVHLEPLDLLARWLTRNSPLIQLIYITCCSGIIYDIIHDVPFTGRDPKTGETIIFSGGNREQYGLEGWIVSISITLVGLFFISVVVSGQKYAERYSALIGVIAIMLIYFVVTQLEKVYKEKGWYGPNFFPPEGYLSGPLSRDQGNNI